MKIIIKKHISSKVNQYLLGKWYWHIEHHALRSQGGISFTYKGAERKALREANRWKYENAQHSITEIEVK